MERSFLRGCEQARVRFVLGVLGVFALVLAATGLFALVAYAVARRTHEIGIRMAPVERPGQVLSSVLARTGVLCAAGVSIGTVIALAAARLLSVILCGVSPRDPATYVTAVLLLTAVSLMACWNPAVRAMRIDQARALTRRVAPHSSPCTLARRAVTA